MNTPDTPSTAGQRFFAAWTRTVLRLRFPLLVATLALTAAAIYQVRTQLQVESSFESLSSRNGEAMKALDAFRANFGRDDTFLVLAEGDVFSMPYLIRLKALHAELEKLTLDTDGKPATATPGGPANPHPAPAADTATRAGSVGNKAAEAGGDDDFGDFDDFGEEATAGGGADKPATADAWGDEGGATVVDQVISLISMRKTRMKGDALQVGELMDPMPTAETLARVKAEALSEPAVMGQVLGPKLRHSVVVVRTVTMPEADSDAVFAQVEALAAKHSAPGFKLSVAGPPALTAWLKAAMLRDMRVLLGSAVGVMLLVLLVLFRHPLGVVGPILVILMSVVGTLGLMATTGMPMTVLTNIMPAFLFAVGLGDAVHLVSVYRDLRRDGVANREAIVEAVSTTGVPLVFTSLTTAMGLVSFRFANVEALAQMGTAAGAGVGLALLHSVVFLPIVLSFNTKSLLGAKQVQGGDRLDRALWQLTGIAAVRTGAWTPGRNRGVLVGAAVVAGLAAWGVSQLGVSHNPLAWLPNTLPIKAAFDTVDEEVGGTSNVQLLIQVKSERGIKDLAFLRGLEKLDRHILAFKDPKHGDIVGASISVLDILRETNKTLHGGDPAWYRLPDSQRGASDLLFLFENSGPDELRRMASADLRTTQLTVRVKWLDAHGYLPLAAHIERGVATHLDGLADVRLTGSVFTLTSTVSGLIDNTMRSFAAALAVITLFMVLLLRNVKLGLVAMVPNLLPIAIILGLMGFLGIPIDMGNLMLASIGIGVAVDDTIHFLHHVRVGLRAGDDIEQAIAASVQHAGRAMVGTTLVLCLGFSVFLTGSLAHLRRFGSLIALTAVVALVVDLVLAPALLRALYKRRDGSSGAATR